MVSYTEAQIYLFTQISEILLRFPTIVMAFECPKDTCLPPQPSCVARKGTAEGMKGGWVSEEQRCTLSSALFGPLARQFLLIRI